MPTDYELPEVGEGIEEAKVLKWLVDEGDEILEDDPVVEVETDKAIIEVPSPVTGTVVEKHVEKGETIDVGEKVVSFDEDEDNDEARGDGGVDIPGEEEGVGSDAAPDRAFASDSTRDLARQLDVDITEVTGTGKRGRITQEDVRRAAEGEEETDRSEQEIPDEVPEAEDKETVVRDDDEELSPEFGQDKAPAVDPETTESTSMFSDEGEAAEFSGVVEEEEEGEPTGPAPEVSVGKDAEPVESIETSDEEGVEMDDSDAEEATSESGGETETTADGATGRTDPFATTDTDESEEGSTSEGVERSSGVTETEEGGVSRGLGINERLLRATELPLVTHHDKADAERLAEVRQRINDEVEIDVSYTPLLVKACGAALEENRILNSVHEENEAVLQEKVNIGVAVTTKERGSLEIPVVEDAGERNLIEIARTTADVVKRAREGDLSEGETEGGTFTVTNVGPVGGEGVTSLVNYPEVATASFGEIKQRPHVDDGEVVARHTLPFSITYDQRVAGGEVVAKFANDLKGYLNEPERLLL